MEIAEKGFALVTGASSGIGRAVAVRLARDGYSVLIHCHQNAAGAEETLQIIRSEGRTADVVQFDVTQPTHAESILDPIVRTGQRTLEVLVNNAGLHRDNLTGLMSDEEFNHVIQTNVYGPFYLLRWCVRRMLKQRSGSIVNIASLAGQIGNPGQLNYSASKGALIAMTKTLAREVGSRGIRVNGVAPGLIETKMLESIPNLDAMKTQIPLQRLGKPEDVAGAVSFLCSPDAAYITGHILNVNGGLLPL